MNCKPGDLAISVVRDSFLRDSGEVWWAATTVSSVFEWTNNKRVMAGSSILVADRDIRPLRGNYSTEETLRERELEAR